MHIGILSLPSNFHCQKWAKALVKAGAKVTVFSFEYSEIEGVKVVRLDPPVTWKGQYRYPSFMVTSRQLEAKLKQHKVDILHPLHLTPFGTWAINTRFKPVISAAMGADVLEYPPAGVTSPADWRKWNTAAKPDHFLQATVEKLKNLYFRQQVSRVCENSNLITADNQTLVNALRDWFQVPEEKIKLLRWGLNPDDYKVTNQQVDAFCTKFNLDKTKRIILSPRGLMPIYQADIVFEAFENLTSQYKDYNFVMLGAGYNANPAFLNNVKNFTTQHSNFQVFTEQLNLKEMAVLWRLTDVFVSVPVYDGYSAALAEGRFMGAIPVVNAIPGNLEVIENEVNGIVVQNLNPQNLAKAITLAIENISDLKPQYAELNYKWILENSTLEQSTKLFLSWCDQLLQKSNK